MNDDRKLPQLRVGDAERDEVLALLQEAYVAGRLDAEEFEERQGRCMAARYREDLALVVADLPEGQAWRGSPPVAAASAYPVAQPAVASGAPRDLVILSGKHIHLDANQRQFSSLAFMGGHNIYLAGALGPGVTVDLDLSTFMGGYYVYVPEGVRVIDEATSILGGISIKKKAQGDGSNGTVVLRGFHFMGGVDVKLSR